MNIKELKNFSEDIVGQFIFDYDLKKTNWLNIGGKAKAYFKPDSLTELVNFIKLFGSKEKVLILGAGSNILINDKVFDGVVIKLSGKFSNISMLPNKMIIAGSGARDKMLSDFALENNIGGLEFLSCIPGTIGGGLRMNSGCFGREFKDIVVSVQAIDKSGNILTIPSSKIKFDYRKSNLSKDLIFLSASFSGTNKSKKDIQKYTKLIKKKKDDSQPTKIKTGGSTFKNPLNQTDKKVWELIKQAVPLNTKFGDAEISAKHCNFFVNSNNASFKDMIKLINFTKESIEKKFGIKLETEIEIIE